MLTYFQLEYISILHYIYIKIIMQINLNFSRTALIINIKIILFMKD